MSQLPSLSTKEVSAALSKVGFSLLRYGDRGVFFLWHKKSGKLTALPDTGGEIPPETLEQVLRQAGVQPKKFLKLLAK